MVGVVSHTIHLTPQGILNLTEKFAHEVGTTLFYSGGSFASAEKSFLCLFPYEFIWTKDQKLYRRHLGEQAVSVFDAIDPWECLKGFLSGVNGDSPYPEWVGYLGYEMGAFSDKDKRLPCHSSSIPDSYFLRPSVVLALDNQTGLGTVFMCEEGDKYLSAEQRGWLNSSEEPHVSAEHSRLRPKKTNDSPEAYRQKVEAAQELIRAGDIYQVNLSQKFVFQGKRNPFELFLRVADINPAPFMAYIHFPQFAIISSSPERFLSKRGNTLETRPIKGTAPRGETPELDFQSQERLLSSPKERAELLMITDLMRNDLGKVSITGSVKTRKIWHCEAYSNVFHLLSIICSEAKPEIHPLDVIRSCFPGGSITGCPKLRAMEVIDELEQSARGIYTGSIGYLAHNGDFDFNIAIRTLLWEEDSIEVFLGGAIVADSDPRQEYEETLHKGASIFKALDTI
ncbi:MAG: aminodeoxychorismate synthase component I [Waddliaceae bacterium]